MEDRAPVRRRGTLFVSLGLWLALLAALVLVVERGSPPPAGAHAPGVPASGSFSHVYPSDPFPFERPPVGTSSPYVESAYRLHTNASATTIARLAAIAAPTTLTRVAPGIWRLTKPLELGVGSTVSLTGPLRLELAPGAFLLAQHGSSLRLSDVTIEGVDRSGRAQVTPVPGRGFIDARSGAVLQLVRDTFLDLGHLGDQTYGVTIDGGSGSSYMRHCTVRGDYFGVYIGRANGVVIADNRFENSVIYGIDPHTYDTNLSILNNTVTGSGVHGIVVADHVTNSTIAGNEVLNSRDHGIVLFQFADHNALRDNVVLGTFDGLVVTDSSSNTFMGNRIGPATRFGIRVSGISTSNVFQQNVVTRTLVGAYVYQGASSNQFIDNSFRANYENVRVRADAPSNTVTPDPGRSEL